MPVPGTKPISIGKKILVSPLHLAGVVVLFIAVILYIWGMFSPAWSYWQGDYVDEYKGLGATRERKDTPEDDWYHYNGPWMRQSCSYAYYNKVVPPYKYERGGTRNYGSFWTEGTVDCIGSVHVHDHCPVYEDFDKCGHLSAVRVLTCMAMVLGLLAFLLSVAGVISVGGPKYPCIGSCLLALIAGVCIFIAICIWASIKNWEKEEMRINCSNRDPKWVNRDNNDDTPDYYDCWGKTGSYPAEPDVKKFEKEPCNDKCDEIDPPYDLGYAYVLCIFAMGLFVIGGALNAAAGLNKRIPSN